ncbi:kinase-like protein [Lentithecium fluviatile CBS 122367]|uniref:Kinase-like protein n=1 Tax=Lentithecium fluviatile CBS 122367 TaxID=1168545 RepID=A0A6G1JPN9_9PLEO|nr:kinase-like protein [Lentithecium fluviatile CBS 122367]
MMDYALDNANSVLDFIDKHTVDDYQFRDRAQSFLPKSALDMVTQREVIQHILAQDENVILSNDEHDALVERIYTKARKLFAICVMCGKAEYLKAMLDNGLTDNDLPLGKSKFGSLTRKGGFPNCFIAMQSYIETIFFIKDEFKKLDDGNSGGFSIPIHFDESKENMKGKGAFGEVWIIKIHPDQRSFSCETNDSDMFALKVTPNEGRERNYHSAMAGLDHPHLVKCLTSFTLGWKYYMVYDLADCDLESFICDNPRSGKVSDLSASWLAQQLSGLAGALRVVHNPGGSKFSSAKNLGVPSAIGERTGYIHDIKPDNILVFQKKDGTSWLRLSDFSCARVVDFVATISGNNRFSYKTNTKSGAPIYRAPESSEGATSRPYDMWSLGCVYLEILVWFIEGYQALLSFRASRKCQAYPHGPTDEGFYYETESGINILREPVVDKIECLSRRCEGGLKDIVDTIPSLLKIEPKERLDASQLVERLKHLGTGTGTRTEAGPSQTDLLPLLPPASFNLPTHASDSDSDSDSDFGGMGPTVKVIHPSDDST